MLEENLEQPIENLGSNVDFGKFKDAESLIKAYSSLEAEFTKKSQKLAMLESEVNKEKEEQNRLAELDKQVEDFVTKFEAVKPFSSALKASLQNQDANLAEEAIKLLSNNYKKPEDYVNDSEFLNNYIFSNKEIKDKIVKDYLSNITQNSPIKIDKSGSSISLTPPKQPTTIAEAGKLAKSIIKQK